MRTRLGWILAPLMAGLLALSVACGGDDDGGSATGGGVAVSDELNLAEAASKLMELQSFRFDMTFNLDIDLDSLEGLGEEDDEFGAEFAAMFLAMFSNVKVEGAYVAPDRFEVQTNLMGQDLRYIQIGNEAWENDGDGWEATEPDMSSVSMFGDPATFAEEMLPDAVLRNAETSQEQVNGIPTARYHFDKAALEAVATELGEDVTDFQEVDEMEFDIWLAEGNIPVKFELKASGADSDGAQMALQAKFELKDLNADIEIERPVP